MKGQKKALTTVVSVIGIALCVVFGLLLIFNLTIIVKGLINPKWPPSVFGITPMVVKSGSMSNISSHLVKVEDVVSDVGLESLKSGDEILVKRRDYIEKNVILDVNRNDDKTAVVSFTTEHRASDHIEVDDLIIVTKVKAEDLKVGDIISFIDRAGTVTTHRIIEVTTDDQGGLAFYTKGDANNTDDSKTEGKVLAANVVGVYKTRVAKLGAFIYFLQKPWGMIIFIGVPVIGYVIYDIIRRKVGSQKDDKKQEELEAELERLRAIAAQQEAAKAAENDAAAPEEGAKTGGDGPAGGVE